ncbi:hypothetical protein NID80_32675, partial [Paraburkholderia megapolitana]|nr:hypothetical protein [Paraburkholderia megapolitana]MDN7161755.1 hypothetical protein [Paraburkholderia sp. CHISQ3]MDQ6498803.1 hypothetical protein [Paraburkholderia megapolitana]
MRAAAAEAAQFESFELFEPLGPLPPRCSVPEIALSVADLSGGFMEPTDQAGRSWLWLILLVPYIALLW